MKDMDTDSVNAAQTSIADVERSPHSAHVTGLSGRELDAAIAERVVGFVRHRHGVLLPNDERLSLWFDDAMKLEAAEGNLWLRVPRYSSDIAAAMEVVENLTVNTTNELMKTLGFAVLTIHRYPDGRWCVGFNGRRASAVAATLPEAICRAALQTVAHQP